MKRIYKRFIYLLFGLLGFMIIGCSSSSSEEILSPEEILEAVSKLELNDLEVEYNGEQHSIYIEGDIPKEVAVSYVGNNKINAGEYRVSAMFFDLTGQVQNLPTLEATLMINKAKLDITFDDQEFSYDGKEHSIYINEELPSGVNVSYINNNKIKEGTYYVTASFTDTTGNYEVPNDMTRELKIVKDGKYHDLTIIYSDGSIETKVVENGYVIDYLPTSNKTGYTNYYINQYTDEEIIFPYVVNNDVIIENHYEPNTYKVNYYYEGDILFSDEVKYDSTYTFKDMYVNDEGNLLIELKYNDEIIEPGTSIKFNYLNDINIEMIYMIPSNDFMFSVSWYYATITGYSGSDTELEIPIYVVKGKNYYKVTSIGSSAFKNCTSLTSIVIPESVTSIEYKAFEGCSSLISIVIPESVTYIGFAAFEGCSSLTIYCEVSSQPSGWGANWNYSNRPVYWGINESNYIEVEGIEYVIIDGEAVVSRYVGNNTEVIIPSTIEINGTTYNVTSIGSYAFEGCISLTGIVIPESVTSIGEGAFYGCSSLTSIVIPESVTIIGYDTFYNCSSLISIVIPEGVTSIGYDAFYNCSSLTSIVIPEGVTGIGDSAFEGCISLTSIVIPESVTSIGEGAFEGCSSLTSITLPNTLTSIGERAFYDCDSLTSITIPEGVTSIGSYAFYNCSSLTSIIIPESVTSIGSSTFYDCFRLTSIVIPKSVKSIGYSAFYNCSSLTSITLPSTLTSIGQGAFSSCSSLTSIVIPESVTSIGSYVFSRCSSLASIVIPESVTSIGDSAFSGCSSLTSIVIPESVTSIGSDAFSSCSSLTSIVIPEGVTSIRGNAFSNCSSLTSIVIPESVTSIKYYAFYGCSSLTSITLPSTLTSIGQGAFEGCSSLISIVIPKSVTSIEYVAFKGCSSLTIYCEASSKPSGWYSGWNYSNRPVYWGYGK